MFLHSLPKLYTHFFQQQIIVGIFLSHLLKVWHRMVYLETMQSLNTTWKSTNDTLENVFNDKNLKSEFHVVYTRGI